MSAIQYITILLVHLFTFLGNNPVRIMPLGDSITAGSYGAGKDGIGGYRAPLWNMLKDENLNIDFIGTLDDPYNAKFDTDHEGWRGWRVDQLNDSMSTWIADTTPDIILLQIGVNDLLQGAKVSSVTTRLNALIGTITEQTPHTILYVASIMNVLDPNHYHVFPDSVFFYNKQIPELVNKFRNENVQFADINLISNLQPGDFAKDRLHPNEAGYLKIARAWKKVLFENKKQLKKTK